MLKSNLRRIQQSKLVFTDDLAPVEIMGQKVLMRIVAAELESFKRNLIPAREFGIISSNT
jgi:hypothetical protein